MDDEPECVALHEIEAFAARKYLERSVNGDGHEGKANLAGQHEGPFLKRLHLPIIGAGAFGEYSHRRTVLQGFAGILDGLYEPVTAGLIYENEASLGASPSHEGYLSERLLHHPLEGAVEIAGNEEDVEGTLVVGNENVTAAWLYVLASLHLDGEKEEATYPHAPYTHRPISPETLAAEGASYAGGKADDEGKEQSEREGY